MENEIKQLISLKWTGGAERARGGLHSQNCGKETEKRKYHGKIWRGLNFIIEMYLRIQDGSDLNSFSSRLGVVVGFRKCNNELYDRLCGQWSRSGATRRKVALSFPDEVTGFFNWPSPSSRIADVVSCQPVTEMSTRTLSERALSSPNWQPHRHLWSDCLGNVIASTSRNRIDLSHLLQA
jgi:hypothetical protein